MQGPGHDRTSDYRAGWFYTRVSGHRQVYHVDRVQANCNALCRLSGYFHLQDPTPFWLPKNHHYGSGIQFPLASVLGFL
jgi:hypothetical protein